MKAKEIRHKFLDFFQSKGHQIVPSAPMVLQNDPTLMFTNAGMNQFKDYFLGNSTPNHNRVTDTQKCLRVSGKHNDLEEVGIDTYHHTMFEMLGNWSFGDYFKKEAIEWAWELLTDVYELPKDRLYITVFEGDKDDKLSFDQEAFDLWKALIPEDRILNGDKKDNFWEMGETGPCGPCSEIHIDLRTEDEIKRKPGKDLVNQDHPLVIEIWNLVFIQYNRKADSSLDNLPNKHIDTGMGFERLAMAIQGKKSNYDTDVFTPLIDKIASKAGVVYGKETEIDIALRVIVDHIRAVSFAIADGQLPSNNKAGYVIRRILRRAVRYGYTFLDFKTPFLNELLPILADQFKDVFPEMEAQKAFIAKVVLEEELSFLKTLEKGLKKLDNLKGADQIDGKTAFELYDTYGFPLDLTALIAKENGMTIDKNGFSKEMEIQKNRSKAIGKTSTSDWIIIHETEGVQFIGYDFLECNARILRYREVKEKDNTLYQVVLDQTPFYAESGGQIGDTGYLEISGKKFSVINTKKENDLIVHFMKELPDVLDKEVHCVVNKNKRVLTENNHTATHLLQSALKDVLGDHVQQKGSLVNENVLRFDFSHFAKMTDEEILAVEQLVNKKIRENICLNEKRNIPIQEALDMGATALFGEKYGDFVRVVAFDPDYSLELCGGTHVSATGRIGLFKIVSEISVAAGVRRIEAITSERAETYNSKQERLLAEIKELLKNPKDPIKAVQQLIEEKTALQKEIEVINHEKLKDVKRDLLEKISKVGDINLIVEKYSFPDSDSLKKLSFELKNEIENLVMIIGAEIKGKPLLSIMISDNLVGLHQLNAGQLIKELAKEIKGGGGGQPFYATAGGKDLSGLDNAMSIAKIKMDELIASEK